jgi:hypothetical protein
MTRRTALLRFLAERIIDAAERAEASAIPLAEPPPHVENAQSVGDAALYDARSIISL